MQIAEKWGKWKGQADKSHRSQVEELQTDKGVLRSIPRRRVARASARPGCNNSEHRTGIEATHG